MARPPVALAAKWEATMVAEGLAPLDDGDPGQSCSRQRKAADMAPGFGVVVAWPHLGSASWRMPRIPGVLDIRGAGPRARRGQFKRRVTMGRQRRILRMLADGATVREVAAATKANFTVIAALRRAALRWKDPDDEC